MVEDYRRVREPPREVREFGQLRVEEHGVERKAAGVQLPEAAREFRVQQQARRRAHADMAVNGLVGIPIDAPADAPEAPAAGLDMGVQNLARPVPDGEVRIADDAGAEPAASPGAPLGPLRQRSHELRLADRPQMLGAGIPVVLAHLDIDRGADIVAQGAIGRIVVNGVAVARPVHQMVVGIDDPEPRLQNGFHRLGHYGSPPPISAAAFSPIMSAGACRAAFGMRGMIEASATHSPSTPRTRSPLSTTASTPGPIAQVPHWW